jgi:hypothetical protein
VVNPVSPNFSKALAATFAKLFIGLAVVGEKSSLDRFWP